VKPSNILVTKDDDIKVLDFGIAKMIGGNQMSFTRTGTQIGTVYYMSPEQVKATGIDQRSDIYSLGVTFYELLAGFCPYRSMTSEYEIFNKIIQEPLLPLNHTLGNAYDEIWEVIARATEKDPDHRIANCEEFSALIGRDVQPHHRQPPVSSAAQASKSSSIQVVIWSIVGAVAIVIIAALIISQNNPTSNGQDPELEQVAEQNSSTSDQASENSQEPVQEQIPEELDFTSEIYNFFSAERRRNLDEIIGFYSPDINRYYTNNNPSIGQIRKEYEASWRKTSYAANENPDVEKIDQYNYVVNVDYHFVMSQSGSERTIKSRLHFTFDADGRIVEVYNP
jgi:serine/threonine protein kinase